MRRTSNGNRESSAEPEDRDLRRSLKRERVRFEPALYDRYSTENVPEHYRKIFDEVQNAGRHNPQRPARTDAQQHRASHLHRHALKCRKEDQNEAGWRYGVEYPLFQRFFDEVSCTTCYKRVQKSEHAKDALAIQHSTLSSGERTDICDCFTPNELPSMHRRGTDIFSFRLEDAVSVPKEDTPDQYLLSQKPDRMIGLSRDGRLDALLSRPRKQSPECSSRINTVESTIRTGISSSSRKPEAQLLFPFLVLEAKSEKGADSFSKVEWQSGGPIKGTLTVQHELFKRTDDADETVANPLVWFLCNKGEIWTVYAAIRTEEEGFSHCVIHRLWEGNITGFNAALQLVRTVDVILDWARERYRPTVMTCLGALGHAESARDNAFELDADLGAALDETLRDKQTLATPQKSPAPPATSEIAVQVSESSDVEEDTPMIDSMPVSDNVQSVNPSKSPAKLRYPTPKPVCVYLDPVAVRRRKTKPKSTSAMDKTNTQFDCDFGIVRDARYVVSRYRAIYVGLTHIKRALKSPEHRQDTISWCNKMRGTLNLKRYQLNKCEDVLDAVETQWTGDAPSAGRWKRLQGKAFVQYVVSYYIDADWKQVRELSCLALTHKAMWYLFSYQEPHLAKLHRAGKARVIDAPECSKESLLGEIQALQAQSVRKDLEAALARESFCLPQGSDREYVADRTRWIFESRDTKPGSMAPKAKVSSRVDGPRVEGCASAYDARAHALVYGHANAGTEKSRYCLYILDGSMTKLDSFIVTAKLLGRLHTGFIWRTSLWSEQHASVEPGLSAIERKVFAQFQATFGETEFGWGVTSGTIREGVLKWIQILSSRWLKMNPSEVLKRQAAEQWFADRQAELNPASRNQNIVKSITFCAALMLRQAGQDVG